MKRLTFSSLCLPDSLKARGVDSREQLPTYFYRDDGLMVWEATRRSAPTRFYGDDRLEKSVPSLLNRAFSLPSFVREVVCVYYKDNEAVQHDDEIQAFVKDVQNLGMRDFDHCGEFKENEAFVINQMIADENEFPFLANRVSQASEDTGGADKVPDHGYIHSFSSARSRQLWTGTPVISERSFKALV